jgi:hypothetical protein
MRAKVLLLLPEDFQLEPEGFGGCFKGLWRKH